uniref:Lens fiber membrane intrinsic protein n=1 Tax=Chelydra serpentina TaxID=8475 RepID=A0A8C3SQW1_CHESE
MYTLMGGGLLCAVSGLVLLIVATATDFWMQYRYSENLSNQGLWRFCVSGKCHPHTVSIAFWDATRAFMLLSILSCFAGIILGLTAFSSNSRASRTRSAGITLLIAGTWAPAKPRGGGAGKFGSALHLPTLFRGTRPAGSTPARGRDEHQYWQRPQRGEFERLVLPAGFWSRSGKGPGHHWEQLRKAARPGRRSTRKASLGLVTAGRFARPFSAPKQFLVQI